MRQSNGHQSGVMPYPSQRKLSRTNTAPVCGPNVFRGEGGSASISLAKDGNGSLGVSHQPTDQPRKASDDDINRRLTDLLRQTKDRFIDIERAVVASRSSLVGLEEGLNRECENLQRAEEQIRASNTDYGGLRKEDLIAGMQEVYYKVVRDVWSSQRDLDHKAEQFERLSALLQKPLPPLPLSPPPLQPELYKPFERMSKAFYVYMAVLLRNVTLDNSDTWTNELRPFESWIQSFFGNGTEKLGAGHLWIIYARLLIEVFGGVVVRPRTGDTVVTGVMEVVDDDAEPTVQLCVLPGVEVARHLLVKPRVRCSRDLRRK